MLISTHETVSVIVGCRSTKSPKHWPLTPSLPPCLPASLLPVNSGNDFRCCILLPGQSTSSLNGLRLFQSVRIEQIRARNSLASGQWIPSNNLDKLAKSIEINLTKLVVAMTSEQRGPLNAINTKTFDDLNRKQLTESGKREQLMAT